MVLCNEKPPLTLYFVCVFKREAIEGTFQNRKLDVFTQGDKCSLDT